MSHAIPQKILEQHTAVLGKTGSGKTSTAKLTVEQVVADDFRVCILDPIKSDWWGVTSSADGKKPGLPFKILGGPHGHVPLHSSAGAVIGQLVGSGKLPLSIIDMADFEAGGLQRFFADFAQALMRNARGVVYLVIEEAHEFAPKERAGFGAENLAIHWAKKLATAGRSKGIRLIVATQRVQSLHNAVLGSCETLIAHRLTTPADQEPVLKWLKANTDKETFEKVSTTLSSLPRGTGWMCSGEEKIFKQVAFPKFKTYDNAATPMRDGKEIEVKTAAVNPDELRSIIGDAVKEAEANDPKRLRARIAELERASKTVPTVDPQALHQERIKGKLEGYAEAIKQIAPGIPILRATAKSAAELADKIEEWTAKVGKGPVHALKPPAHAPKPPVHATKQASHATPPEGITGPQKRILDAIALLSVLGVKEIQKNQVAAVAAASPTSSAFANNLGSLRTAGHIDYPRGGQVALTSSGSTIATFPDITPTVDDLHRAWLNLLPGPQGKILLALIEQYPEPAPKEALAEQVGASSTSSAFANNLGALRSLGVIDYPNKGMVVATDVLFPVAA